MDEFLLNYIKPTSTVQTLSDPFLGWSCEIDEACSYSPYTVVFPLQQFYIYSAVNLVPSENEGDLCSQTMSHTLYIFNGSSWVKASSSTVIKYTGVNPQTNIACQPAITCDASLSPHSSFYVQAQTGYQCTTQHLKIDMKFKTGSIYTSYYDVFIDDGTCSVDQVVLKDTYIPLTISDLSGVVQNRVYFDNTLLYFFLGVILILSVLLNIKRK